MQQPFSEDSKAFLKNHLAHKLSRREVEVVVLVLEGMTNREVANQLCVAEKTVKFHLTNIYKKLNISRRSQIIWTLPLADFIGAKEKQPPKTSLPTGQSFPTDNSAANAEPSRIIPAGCVTVADQES